MTPKTRFIRLSIRYSTLVSFHGYPFHLLGDTHHALSSNFSLLWELEVMLKGGGSVMPQAQVRGGVHSRLLTEVHNPKRVRSKIIFSIV